MRTTTSVFDLKVFTDAGEYFGDIDEAVIEGNRIFGWRVKSGKDSVLSKVIGGAKGVIVPHSLIRAIGDIVIISRAAVPSMEATQTNISTAQ